MRIAVLVKQVPKVDHLEIGADGRLRRNELELEMNAYCRRAVSKGVELARDAGGSCTVFTLGPPAAADVLREAIAWGADDGVIVSGCEFAGSDTLATATALAAALDLAGPYDLVLVGRNSIDADTGQVGPQLAELLDLPFLGGVRELRLDGTRVSARCETDDGWLRAAVDLPALLSTAERLCDPAKMPPAERAAVPDERIRRLAAADLGPGPWGASGSTTHVGEVRVVHTDRAQLRLNGDIQSQVEQAVDELLARGALVPHATAQVPDARGAADRPATSLDVPDDWQRGALTVAVVVEPDRARCARELLSTAAVIAKQVGGSVCALLLDPGLDVTELGTWGADCCVHVVDAATAADAGPAVGEWCEINQPWAVLAPGTMWGREVASRAAARTRSGLTGDTIELSVDADRLVAWKPAFGGEVLAAITASTPTQMVTVRPGVLPALLPRGKRPVSESEFIGSRRGRVRVSAAGRDDELEPLAAADVVIGVGRGVAHEDYPEFDELRHILRAEIGATRKITDVGWLPRARQIGITGRSIAPRMYLAVGISGTFNHSAGIRGSHTVVAINTDPSAPIFDHADIGLVADWREVLPVLTRHLVKLGIRPPSPSTPSDHLATRR